MAVRFLGKQPVPFGREIVMSPAKTPKQKRFLEGVAHGNIHRKGITPEDAKKALGQHPPKKKKS